MGSKKYSSPPVNNRFDFSASGNYRAPFKLEPLLTGLFVGVCGTVGLLLILFVLQFQKKNLNGDPSDKIVIAAMFLILAAVEALVVAVAIVLVKIVRSGYVCSYMADKNRFITNEGGNTRTIYFDEVQSVNFFPKTVFGAVRGYDVNVRLNGYDETYSIVSEGFLSEKSTPFYIIVERVEKIRRDAAHERYEAEMAKLGSASQYTAPQPGNGRPAPSSRLGQDAAMPAVSLSAMAAAASAKPDEFPTKPDEYPTKPDEASAKPGESPAKPGERNETYVDSNGRERLYNEVIGSGRFKVMCTRKKTVTLALIAAAAPLLSYYLANLLYNTGIIPIMSYLVLLMGIAAVGLMAIIFLIGDECTYHANGREFVVTDKKGGETHIAYENAQSVHYFNTMLGYKVEILTVYGVISFNCIYKRKKTFLKSETLPFDIIAKKIKE